VINLEFTILGVKISWDINLKKLKKLFKKKEEEVTDEPEQEEESSGGID
jgi:hypothetical protein